MVLRQSNFLGQARLDVRDFRAAESSVAADFDALAGRAMAGSKALVVTGFNVVMTGAVGKPASQLQVVVAGASVLHPNASESGTIFWAPSNRANETLNATTNPNVTGSFASGTTNFVGIDLRRQADSTTSDVVQFLTSSLVEVAKTVPLARTLNYRFAIGASDFASQPNVLPIAQVVTDANGNVTSVTDARQMAFRLGLGGDVPNIQHGYPWPGTRAENLTGDVFSGGDKAIPSLKDWMDAAMTRIWETSGGEYWYSATADRNVTMIWGGSFFSDGEAFEWTGTNVHWQGIKFYFDNSTVNSNTVADQLVDSPGLTDLADGQCIYVDLDRTGANPTRNAAKGTLLTLGQSAVPGQRQIMAWRIGAQIFTRGWRYPVGTTFTPATNTSLGVVKLTQVSGTPLTPAVFNPDSNFSLTFTATGGNANALTVTGNGTGNGVSATGGGTSGSGLSGTGGGSNGAGVTGTGTGTGAGVSGTGGATNAPGIKGQGTGTGAGVSGTGGGTASAIGVSGTGGAAGGVGVSGTGTSNSAGVSGQGAGSGAGVSGTGGATAGAAGVSGTGGSTNGVGVSGAGIGSGAGGTFTGGATGLGISASGGTGAAGGSFTAGTNADGVDAAGNGSGTGGAFTGTGTRGAIKLVPQTTPSTPANGDMWVDTNDNYAKVQVNGTTYKFAGNELPSCVLYFGGLGTGSITASLTKALPPGNGALQTYSTSGTNAKQSFAIPAPRAGVLKNMYVNGSDCSGLDVHVQVGVSTNGTHGGPLLVAGGLLNGAIASDTVHTQSIAAGDLIWCWISTDGLAGTETFTNLVVSVELY